MLEIKSKQKVEELKVEVTLRLVDGEPDNEITEALMKFLPEEEEPKKEEEEEDGLNYPV